MPEIEINALAAAAAIDAGDWLVVDQPDATRRFDAGLLWHAGNADVAALSGDHEDDAAAHALGVEPGEVFLEAVTTKARVNLTGLRGTVASKPADANHSLQVGVDPPVQVYTGTLTADRTVILSPLAAFAGAWFRIARPGGGGFALTIGLGPLKALAGGQWCELHYDGATWLLTAAGDL